MATMRVVQVGRANGPLEIVERPIPEPPAGSVRIKVQACGVCHSDSVTKEGLFPGIQFPRVPGHEVVGIIDAVGAGVTRFVRGDRHVQQCKRGHAENHGSALLFPRNKRAIQRPAPRRPFGRHHDYTRRPGQSIGDRQLLILRLAGNEQPAIGLNRLFARVPPIHPDCGNQNRSPRGNCSPDRATGTVAKVLRLGLPISDLPMDSWKTAGR